MTIAPDAAEAVTLDGSRFRGALAHVPTSVVVASTMVDSRPIGMVIGSFTAISSDPPLVGFFGDRRSASVDLLLQGERVAFSLISEDGEDVCEAFRRPMDERFASIEWRTDAHGMPVPEAAVLVVDATVSSVTDAGDHRTIIASVLDVDLPRPLMQPLVYVDRRLTKLRPSTERRSWVWQLGWDF